MSIPTRPTLAPVRAFLGHPLVKASVASAVIIAGVSIVHGVQQELQDRLDALSESIGHRTAELHSLRAQAARARADATFPDRAPVDDPAAGDPAPVDDVDQADAAPAP